MQETILNITYSGLKKLVLFFNNYILGKPNQSALPYPVPNSRFLSSGTKEKIFDDIIGKYQARQEPSNDQPLCERIPNRLFQEYKEFLQGVLEKNFAQVYEHIRYLSAVDKIVQYICDSYNWQAAMENDLGGVNAWSLKEVEKLLEKGAFFQSLHTWMNIHGEPDLSDDQAVAKSFFSFISHQRRRGK